MVSGAQSVTSYVYLATPVSQGQTGVCDFGGDSSGVLCFTPSGAAPGTTGTIALATTCNILS